MKFECGDLEHALRHAELMPEAREHLKHCPLCRREYHLWNEISSSARELHESWDTPALWPNIRAAIEVASRPERNIWRRWPVWTLAAAVLLIAIAVPFYWQRAQKPSDRDFLTEQALAEVEKSEAAYRQSIEKLSKLADAKLKRPASPYVVNEREKVLALDAAIADTRSNIRQNRFNLHLQTTLADLYREKQQTLQELLTREQKN